MTNAQKEVEKLLSMAQEAGDPRSISIALDAAQKYDEYLDELLDNLPELADENILVNLNGDNIYMTIEELATIVKP